MNHAAEDRVPYARHGSHVRARDRERAAILLPASETRDGMSFYRFTKLFVVAIAACKLIADLSLSGYGLLERCVAFAARLLRGLVPQVQTGIFDEVVKGDGHGCVCNDR
jgi:hypothetical protein